MALSKNKIKLNIINYFIVIIYDNHTYTAEDYAMMRNSKKWLASVTSIALMMLSLSTFANNDIAATATAVKGLVTATNTDGDTRIIKKGDNVFSGDSISTKKRSKISLTFTDNSKYILREKTNFIVSNYAFSGKEDGSEKAEFKITTGALEAISGFIGKTFKKNYRLDTPLSTIGIRGTSFQVEVIRIQGQEVQVRVATLEGTIIYSSIVDGTSNAPSPIKSTTALVDVDEATGEITSILIDAGKQLTQKEQGAIERAVGTLFPPTTPTTPPSPPGPTKCNGSGCATPGSAT